MATITLDITDVLQRVRAEYREMPGLRLTQRQAQRLWNLDSSTCETVLDILESTRFLRRTLDQSVRACHTGTVAAAEPRNCSRRQRRHV